MRKLLEWVWVIQVKTFTNDNNRKVVKRRLNPYNPLTYIVMLIFLIVGVIMFGVVGLKNEVNMEELMFKWVR